MITAKSAVRRIGNYLGATALATVVLLGYLAISSPLAATAQSHNGSPASALSSASTVSESSATMNISPTPEVAPSFGYFAGTGDGSEDSWIRPRPPSVQSQRTMAGVPG
jgi:hypothetical protein